MTTATAPPPASAGARGRDRPGPVAARLGCGPLLAVCGLAGGVGVTTLSYLTALAAARNCRGQVLVADTGGPSGGLALCAELSLPCSLSELAEELAAGLPPRQGIYARGHGDLRVIAAAPEFTSRPTDDSIHQLLAHAREAHALTVIDCGTLTRPAEQAVAAAATHIAWVLPATSRGIERGRGILDAAPPLTGKELIVARNEPDQPRASLRALRRLAADRGVPLVLMPHLRGLDSGPIDTVSQHAQVPVQAILGAVTR